MLQHGRLEGFGGRVQAAHGLGKPAELPPEVVGGDVLLPVPDLAGAGRAGEERRKQDVVQQRAGAVGLVEKEWAASSPWQK